MLLEAVSAACGTLDGLLLPSQWWRMFDSSIMMRKLNQSNQRRNTWVLHMDFQVLSQFTLDSQEGKDMLGLVIAIVHFFFSLPNINPALPTCSLLMGKKIFCFVNCSSCWQCWNTHTSFPSSAQLNFPSTMGPPLSFFWQSCRRNNLSLLFRLGSPRDCWVASVTVAQDVQG